MASELLKRQALINKLKEPNVEDVNFDLANSSLDYSIESITEDILPEPKPAELFQEREKVRSERLLNTLDTLEGGLMDESVDFIKRDQLAFGSRDKPKRGLVDEPGSYAGEFGQKYLYRERGGGYKVAAKKGDQKVYKPFPKNKLKEAIAFAKKVEERFDKIEAKKPRDVTGKKLTVYNKFSQDLYSKNYNDLTKAEKNLVTTRYRQSDGKFRKTFQTDALTELNQERIKKAFPDVEFEFKKGQKYGVIKNLKNGKRNPVFTAVNDFVARGYKLSLRKSLPVSTQRNIVARFELPKGVKEWNFDVQKGGYLYGIPDTAGANMNLGARIKNFVNEPKPFKLAADFGTPEGWLLSQMNRAFESKQNPNFIPKYDLVNGKKKIVGFTDNQYGGGKTYYALKKYANKFNGTMMTEHPDFKNTKKYIDIANKVKLAPNKVIKDLLIKGGVTDDRITLNNLLQYMVNEKGVKPTQRALVLHHKGGVFANPTRDFQILNFAVNQNIKGVELAMRSNPANITPKNIKFLKDAGASITIAGKTYGGGPKTAIGGFRQAEQFVQKKLEGFGDKDFKNLSKYLAAVGCGEKRFAGQTGGAPTRECILAGANKINTGNIPKGAGERNFIKFFNTASSIAKKTGQGLRLFTKLAIIPEAAILGVESAVRMSRGDTLSEALKQSISYIPGLGGKAEEADLSRVSRYLGKDDAKYVRNLRNFEKAQQELNNVISAQDADFALAGTEFDEMSSGESQTDVVERYKPKIAEKEKALQDASISQPEELFARSLEDEFADIKDLKRGLTRRQKRQELNVISPEDPETESLITPEITQEELNKRIVEQQPTVAEEIFDPLIKNEEDSDLKKQKAQELLNLMLALEELGVTDKDASGTVENVRRGQFEDAYLDSALAEQLFGPSRTFGGEPVDLENYVPSDRFEGFRTNQGIYAIGGRVGFAEGPKDPNRRFFLKLMGGIMSIPVIGKFLKPLKPAIKPLSNTTTKMPEWFPQLVEKFTSLGTSKKITKKTPGADLPLFAEEATIIEVPQLPGVRFEKYDNGVIKIEGKNAYNEPYEIKYEPPGEYKSLETGKIQKTEGDFAAADTVYYRTGDPREMDYDVDYSVVEDLDDILGGDSTKLEGFAKGTGEVKYTKGAKQVDDADAQFNYDDPLSENPAYRPSDARADVIEGPDVDLSDYYDD